jgi:hypothetical protein
VVSAGYSLFLLLFFSGYGNEYFGFLSVLEAGASFWSRILHRLFKKVAGVMDRN